mmetsp:Transcript_3785/g.11909  ORF Transcript_3785/g.11909 Transcript_3785/m.11909 type:complete len:251 (+) Transcript_3785:738-1490(+)
MHWPHRNHELQRAHVVIQVGYECGPPTEDVVTAEKAFLLLQPVAAVVHGVAGRVVRDQRGAFGRDHVAVLKGVEVELRLELPVEQPGALDEPVVPDELLLRPLRWIPAQRLSSLRLIVWPLDHAFSGHVDVSHDNLRLVARGPVLQLQIRKEPALPDQLNGGVVVVRIGQLADRRVHAVPLQKAYQPTVVVVVHVGDKDLLQSFDAVCLHALVQRLHKLLVPQLLLTSVDQHSAFARAYQIATRSIQREG